MSRARLLLVEDEAVVAMDLGDRLGKLGYQVLASVSNGEEAVRKANQLHPDLVLMDINLRGPLDGVAAAAELRKTRDTPIVYLTAHSDEATVRRASVTEPYGYLLKPFVDKEILATIEIALYKHAADLKLRRCERWIVTAMASLGDAVVSTDLDGLVNYMNPACEALTGHASRDACGRPLAEIVPMKDPSTGRPIESVVARVLREGLVIDIDPGALLVTKDGRELPIDDSAAPIRDARKQVVGVVMCFRDTSARQA